MRAFSYKIIRFLFNAVTYVWLGMKVYGAERIPQSGAFIVACNHASYFDPPLLGTAMRRRLIHFMAKEELFRNPLMGRFLRYVHTFPVRRGHVDRKAVVESLRILREGHVLGIFPEGTSRNQGKLGRFHEGMAAIAIKAGVPVLPAAVVNSRTLPKKSGPVCVAFGEPLYPPRGAGGKEDVETFTAAVHAAVERLLDRYGGAV
ncbi:lysophospholipid acyltransferase family protein [Megasphaera vaginalis (ex Srinivasan et al. 2021)]|uniref:1-acyl-sn-glycerol-3-phosphate acyltransferase n=1 Tax=Megasphaera vaginalis (ex Srinivasan et al. 2021) TaxID=1111454 RepID=U7UFR1_9FIRM|nr:lysophospholipid acyltransferase family protein [Megasphaera vaginalis (ex Srinivasan et al. 2021)]ERT58185.1 acyltransferase [Megasphaera vaginalis (ex Srinivasan et al. 2021)]